MIYKLKQFDIESFYKLLPKNIKYLDENKIKTLILKIGIFKLKGYLYPLKKSCLKEDIIFTFLFDRFLIKELLDITFEIELALKSYLVENSYKIFDNPFFYLIKKNYKKEIKLDNTLNNWKNKSLEDRHYPHYLNYYHSTYNFHENFCKFLKKESLLKVDLSINYPPFHYLIESATLGLTIKFIFNLKEIKVNKTFNINNPKTFEGYLLRLNELRNRLAHFHRIYNRNYRSVRGIGKFKSLRQNIENHSLYDVILFLFFLTNRLNFTSIEEFEKLYIENLFNKFKEDNKLNQFSFDLLKNILWKILKE